MNKQQILDKIEKIARMLDKEYEQEGLKTT